jgi:hypothetical protein
MSRANPVTWLLLIVMAIAFGERVLWVQWQCTHCGKTNTTGPFKFIFGMCDHGGEV